MAGVAYCAIRHEPHYRHQAFEAGLQAAGYRLIRTPEDWRPRKTDLMVIWNRYGQNADRAGEWERRGGTVLVCENGYYGRDEQGRQYYAIAMGAHNGNGQWPTGGAERLDALNIDFQPWRTAGQHILICLQRGIGPPEYAQPNCWDAMIVAELRKLTGRQLKIRPHPGRVTVNTTLAQDLRGAWAVVTWASNAATEALIAGIPVFYCGPHIITEGAAIAGVETIENPQPGDRLTAFQRMALAQWSVSEIEQGIPFNLFREMANGCTESALPNVA